MLEIGSFIKMQRTKKKMTLGELADGIVSVSYLSKIENLKTEASPHIIELLCNRLGVEVSREMDSIIEDKCEAWIDMMLNKQDNIDLITEAYRELQEMFDTNLSDVLLLFELHKIRYFLYVGDTDNASKQISRLHQVTSSFETRELYYWYKFRGNFHSELEENKTAIDNYIKAEELSRKLDISEEELADLHYALSVTYSQLRQILEAIDYANKALDVYMKQYNFIRCAQCHIVLGVSYRRIKMYEKAIENYNLAKHLANLSGKRELIQLTNQNLGYLYATLGKNKEAIKYYREVANDEQVGIEDSLVAITELIKVYYEIDEWEKANEKLERAFELIKEHPKNSLYEYYNYVLYTYHYAINDEPAKFVAHVKDKFIPFLIKREDHVNLAPFTTMLARYYESIHKYKDATKYYKLANQSYNELSTI
jgi:tetratricopeptide (TPR) repeat protein